MLPHWFESIEPLPLKEEEQGVSGSPAVRIGNEFRDTRTENGANQSVSCVRTSPKGRHKWLVRKLLYVKLYAKLFWGLDGVFAESISMHLFHVRASCKKPWSSQVWLCIRI